MTPFFFGDSAAPLLGVLHEPPPAIAKNQGVLLCPPIAQEHIRSHWALRQVAIALAKGGYHCLRFDWFGVGDSAGRLAEATIARWTDDATLAAQELRDVSGVPRLSIVGLRLGATIAALAASRIEPDALVLWDPVLDGDAYTRGLRRLHEEVESDSVRYWEPTARHSSGSELVGFDFGPTLLREIRALDVSKLAFPKAKIRLLCSSLVAELTTFEATLQKGGHDVSIAYTALEATWESRHHIEELLLAADAGKVLQSLLGEQASSQARWA